jgi:cellulose synthase/poly-beta-1,6-N-acetylglucosamine synthase-like glycosyltransferase
MARKKRVDLPRIAIFVPARNEGKVIGNTLRRLVKLDYPKKYYQITVIVDERELDDEVEVLTKKVVSQLARKFNKKFGRGFINCLQVPKWYSGRLGDKRKTYQKSSKGRALNYTLDQFRLQKKMKKIDLIGVLDADGRLDRNVLKEVAYKRLTCKSRLLQGPVFQVSNFSQVKMIGVSAGLELAIHHMTTLARRLHDVRKKPQFLAGTNYFIDSRLIVKVGGWDDQALVEDAELALRAYVLQGVRADWLSWPETEQTPPNFSVYRRQRDRWVRGHLDLVPSIIRAKISLQDKARFLKDIYLNIFRVFIDLGIPLLGWSLMISGILLDLGSVLRYFSLFLLIMSFFIWDFYGLMYRKLSRLGYISNKRSGDHLAQSAKLILFMPVFILAQSVPRLTGSFKHFFGWQKGVWYKTERTKERIME